MSHFTGGAMLSCASLKRFGCSRSIRRRFGETFHHPLGNRRTDRSGLLWGEPAAVEVYQPSALTEPPFPTNQRGCATVLFPADPLSVAAQERITRWAVRPPHERDTISGLDPLYSVKFGLSHYHVRYFLTFQLSIK